MKKKIYSVLFAALMFGVAINLSAQVTVTGAAVIADGTSYTTLKGAFDAINTNAASQSGKNILVQIGANTTETAIAAINAGNWTSLTVYPTVGGLTISSSLASQIITIGGSNVTFDGRVNQTGARDLSITNTLASASTPYTFLIQEPTGATGLSNVTVKYCNIKANNTSAGKGNVTVSFTGTPTVAMSNINIQNNLITGRCAYSVYAKGVSAALPTTGLTVSNNELKNCFLLTAAAAAIIIDANQTGASISGNSIYDDSAPFTPTGGFAYTGITVSGGGGNTISDNFIGGNAVSCGGTLTKVNTTNNAFVGISLTTSGTGTATSVQNNTIKGLTWPNSTTANWTGILVAGTNNVNIGTITGNTVGATTGTGSISISNAGAATIKGIDLTSTTGTTDCRKNNIGSITAANTSTNASTVYVIAKSGAATAIISNNTIGSTSTANSINSTNTSTTQSVTGINCGSTGSVTVSNNTISNLTNGTTSNTVYGINIGITAPATALVNGNFIQNLNVPNSATAKLNGITAVSGVGTYTNNIVNIGSGNGLATIYGLYDTGPASSNSSILHNTIYIGGSQTSGGLASFALYSAASTNIRDIRNNIFCNARTTVSPATGNNFGARYSYTLANVGSLTLDYNNYSATGTNGYLGLITGGSNSNTLPLFTGYDNHSVATNPTFANAAGSSIYDFGTTAVIDGISAGITTDIINTTRTIFRIGAFEYNSVTVPIANAVDKSATRIARNANGVVASFDGLANVELYTANGKLIDKTVANGTYSRNLVSGIYILRVNGKATKFVK